MNFSALRMSWIQNLVTRFRLLNIHLTRRCERRGMVGFNRRKWEDERRRRRKGQYDGMRLLRQRSAFMPRFDQLIRII